MHCFQKHRGHARSSQPEVHRLDDDLRRMLIRTISKVIAEGNSFCFKICSLITGAQGSWPICLTEIPRFNGFVVWCESISFFIIFSFSLFELMCLIIERIHRHDLRGLVQYSRFLVVLSTSLLSTICF